MKDSTFDSLERFDTFDDPVIATPAEGTTSEKKKRGWRISFNAPVTLCFVVICAIVTFAGTMTANQITTAFFATYLTSFLDPMFYLRLVTHVFGHGGWDHFTGNMVYILLLGPLLEEKYGGKTLILVIVCTGVVTGLINALLFPTTALCGASGVVFAFIIMSSVTNAREGEIPLTFILVFLVFVGQQVFMGITVSDNISNMAHIIGGLIGGIFGFVLSRKPRHKTAS
ncbi:MAG: rhomboid family intramembrane serine protease [Eggerthellaceae bacterium]|nr:rhomboid family intramembrane serine protease [Eggerthellaceae bacterium]